MERFLFEMPATLEPFIAATAVVQAFCEKKDCEVVLICNNPTVKIFLPVFPKQTTLVNSFSARRGDFDLLVSFDERAAYKIARRTGKHIVQIFGLLIGADPMNSYPTPLGDFSKMERGDERTDVLVWGVFDKLALELSSNILFEKKLSYTIVHEGLARQVENNAGYVYQIVQEHKTVIGVRSSVTYLASSYRKTVVELYDTAYYKGWLSKWTNPKYQMIYGDSIKLETIVSALEAIWARGDLEESTGRLLSTPMEQQTSSVENAEEKSQGASTHE